MNSVWTFQAVGRKVRQWELSHANEKSCSPVILWHPQGISDVVTWEEGTMHEKGETHNTWQRDKQEGDMKRNMSQQTKMKREKKKKRTTWLQHRAHVHERKGVPSWKKVTTPSRLWVRGGPPCTCNRKGVVSKWQKIKKKRPKAVPQSKGTSQSDVRERVWREGVASCCSRWVAFIIACGHMDGRMDRWDCRRCCSLATCLPLTMHPPSPCVSPYHVSVMSPLLCPPIVTRRPLSHLYCVPPLLHAAPCHTSIVSSHCYAPSLHQASVTKMHHHSLCTAAPVNAVLCYYILELCTVACR